MAPAGLQADLSRLDRILSKSGPKYRRWKSKARFFEVLRLFDALHARDPAQATALARELRGGSGPVARRYRARFGNVSSRRSHVEALLGVRDGTRRATGPAARGTQRPLSRQPVEGRRVSTIGETPIYGQKEKGLAMPAPAWSNWPRGNQHEHVGSRAVKSEIMRQTSGGPTIYTKADYDETRVLNIPYDMAMVKNRLDARHLRRVREGKATAREMLPEADIERMMQARGEALKERRRLGKPIGDLMKITADLVRDVVRTQVGQDFEIGHRQDVPLTDAELDDLVRRFDAEFGDPSPPKKPRNGAAPGAGRTRPSGEYGVGTVARVTAAVRKRTRATTETTAAPSQRATQSIRKSGAGSAVKRGAPDVVEAVAKAGAAIVKMIKFSEYYDEKRLVIRRLRSNGNWVLVNAVLQVHEETAKRADWLSYAELVAVGVDHASTPDHWLPGRKRAGGRGPPGKVNRFYGDKGRAPASRTIYYYMPVKILRPLAERVRASELTIEGRYRPVWLEGGAVRYGPDPSGLGRAWRIEALKRRLPEPDDPLYRLREGESVVAFLPWVQAELGQTYYDWMPLRSGATREDGGGFRGREWRATTPLTLHYVVYVSPGTGVHCVSTLEVVFMKNDNFYLKETLAKGLPMNIFDYMRWSDVRLAGVTGLELQPDPRSDRQERTMTIFWIKDTDRAEGVDHGRG